MLGVITWCAGVVLLLGAAAFSLIGLSGPLPQLITLDPSGWDDLADREDKVPDSPEDDGWPDPAEGERIRARQRTALRSTRIGVLLAALGGLALAFGTQPWAA